MALMAVAVLAPAERVGRAAEPAIPEDTCILELNLPPGAEVSIDGRDYGTKRRFTFQSLQPGELHEREVQIRFSADQRQECRLLLEGGHRVRLPLPGPGTSRPELVLQVGHAAPVESAAFSPDGRQLLTGSYDGTAILWDATSGKKLRTFECRELVESVTFSPDGRQLLIGANDGTAILWDAASGKRLQTFAEDGWFGRSIVAFTPDGRQVFTAGPYDSNAISWDAASGEKLRTFKGYPGDVLSRTRSPDGHYFLTAVDGKTILWDGASGRRALVGPIAFSPDGHQVLTNEAVTTDLLWDHVEYRLPEIGDSVADFSMAAAQGKAILWDLVSGKRLRTFEGHAGLVTSVAFSPDGCQVLTAGSEDGIAILWDAASGRRLQTFGEHGRGYISILFRPDGCQVLTAGANGTAILWDVATARKLRAFEGHPVAFSPDGCRVLTAGATRRTAMVWDAASGEKLRTFKGYPGDVLSLTLSPDGLRLLTNPYSRRSAILWDVASGMKLRTFKRRYMCSSLAVSPDGRRVLTAGSTDGTAMRWSTDSGRKLRTFEGCTPGVGNFESAPTHGIYAPIGCVAFSPDGQQVITGASDAAILWDARLGGKLQTWKFSFLGALNVVAFSPDGGQVLTGSCNESATPWDAVLGTKLHVFGEGLTTVYSVAFSPDGRHVLTGLCDAKALLPNQNLAVLWDATSGEKLRTFGRHSASVQSVAFSPDGRHVLTGSQCTAVLWDVTSGEKLRTFEGHTGLVQSVAFSPDGRHVLTGSGDSTAVLWDATSGNKLRTFEGHTGGFRSVAFRSDGRLVLTSCDGTARFWDVATGQELTRLLKLNAGKDWLVTTPEGLFDGSRGGHEKVMFRVGGGLNVVPVDRFFQDFYYPGLLAEIWQGKRPMPDKQLGQNPAPEVQILLRDPVRPDASQMTIGVAVTDHGGGIQAPWLFSNGLRTSEPEDVHKDGKKLQCSFTVSLVGGENRIEVQSASQDGSWESEPAVLTIDYDGTLPAPELHLLAIGINRFQGAEDLKGSVAAAEAMVGLFESRHARHYAEVHVTSLHDAEATSTGILSAIESVAQEAGPQDTLVVYVASHGWTIGQRYYLLPHEYRRADGQTIDEAVRQWGLPVDELGSKLSQVPALKRVLIFDTCKSGSAVESERSPFEFRGAVERFARSQGIFTLAASAAGANTFEHEMTGDMGILTFTLLAGVGAIEDEHDLLGGARVESDNAGGQIDVLDWFRFAEQRMPSLAEKLAGQKSYHVEQRGREPDFPLLRLK